MIQFRRWARSKALDNISKSNHSEAAAYPSLFHFHVPKTAGTSLRRFLEDNLSVADVCESVRLQTLFSELLETSPFPRVSRGMLSGHLPIETLDCFDSPVVSIVVVREPAAQCRSVFYQYRRNGVLPASMSFREFLFAGGASNLCSFQCRWLAGFHAPGFPMLSEEPLSQQEILAQCRPYLDGGLAAAAKKNLARFTFVLLTDRLDEGLGRLARQLGLLRAADLGRENPRPLEQDDEALDESAANLLGAVTAADRELYESATALYEKQGDLPASLKCGLFNTEHLQAKADEIWCDDFSFPIAGDGWYQREFSHSWGGFRWSGAKSTIRVNCRFEAGVKYRFRMLVLGVMDERDLDQSCVVLGDNRIPLSFRRQDTVFFGGGEFLAKTSQAFDAYVELHVPHACCPPPVSAKVFDPRTLGFAVKWMGIFRMPPTNGSGSYVQSATANS